MVSTINFLQQLSPFKIQKIGASQNAKFEMIFFCKFLQRTRTWNFFTLQNFKSDANAYMEKEACCCCFVGPYDATHAVTHLARTARGPPPVNGAVNPLHIPL